MVARLDPCNPDALRLLLADRLPPARVGELEDHLQRCPGCRRALDEMVGGDSWWSAVRQNLSGTVDPEGYFGDTHPADDHLDFLAPTDDPSSLGRIGGYEVKGILGRGGNGVVVKAFDAGLNRFVAVKVIASVLSGSGAARKRFLREAQAAAAVVHEHVIAVYATGEANGLPYLVMEYVMGRSLQDRLDKQGPLGLKEILRIGHQTAAGLAAAHAQGLVHRDIKPANILLENGVERVKITDFGLARAVTDACLTQSGVITGTPHYMAPEQARGDAVDHRCDLFSLGSTLYAMCTGHPPFRADSPLAVLRRVTDDTPRPIREVNPDIPGWLDAIIAKLLAKNPDDRFQSASEVALLFERCLAHVQQPLNAPLPAVPAIPTADGDRRKRLAARVGLAAGLTAIAAGVTLALVPPGDRNATDGNKANTMARQGGPEHVGPGGAAVRTQRATELTGAQDELDAELRALRDQFPAMAHGESRSDVIDTLLVYLREKVAALKARLTAAARPTPGAVEQEMAEAAAWAKELEKQLKPNRTWK